MKRIISFALIAVLAVLTLTACGKSEFTVTENYEKYMRITAKKANKDDYFMVGSLEVDEGEQIKITSDLTKGSIRVELVKAPEDQSIEEYPDMDNEATITANLHATDGAAGTVSAGTYLLRATCLEKATGTVYIEVTPAE